jgi:AraC-like DNA-binding protein/mannose-6-phosphate isomerase-like protein (cupin superfamily)
MKLLYSAEHLRCIHYDQEKSPIIELVSVEKGGSWENLPIGNKLFFLLTGEMLFSIGQFTDCTIGEKQILYLPAGYKFAFKSKKDSTFLVMHIQGQKGFCDDYHFSDLGKEKSDVLESSNLRKEKPVTLEINEIMEKYLDLLIQCIQAGAKCKCFYHLKIKELFYIFRWFYPKEILFEFFRHVLYGEDEFSSFIIDNWHIYKSVGELSEAMHYTISGFEKRFKRVFGISPYKWMTTQKAERIFHQVRNTDLALKQISADFGFTSLSRFNDFCKAHLGQTPGNIRENNKIGGNQE